jgi:adenosylcobinamide-phosphate synthase
VGVLGDLVWGEPPIEPHPVALFGEGMGLVERLVYRPTRWAGAVHTALGTGAGLAAGCLVSSTALATSLAVAHRGLAAAASGVADALAAEDLDLARGRLPALVGRDPSALGPDDVARAVVESVAENTVDAVVAPALWGAVAGAPGALGYRAVNTMDAMVGHRSERYREYGWASARLDDAANYVPARVTAALVAIVRPHACPIVWRTVRRDAPHHPSPNAGVAEAAFAAALGLRLGGPSRYGDRLEVRPALGCGRPPQGADIGPAVRLSRDVTIALALGLVAWGLSG